MLNCTARPFVMWTLCACMAVTSCLSERKLTPHFGLQISTPSPGLENILGTARVLNRLLKVTANSCSLKAWWVFSYLEQMQLFSYLAGGLLAALISYMSSEYLSHKKNQKSFGKTRQPNKWLSNSLLKWSFFTFYFCHPFLTQCSKWKLF